MKKILLLDIENVTVKADEIFAFCQKYDRVYVSFAKTPAIFALQDIELLSKLLNYKLFLITMTENKKSNGADFGLAFYARVLSGQFKPNKTKFYILSSDRDFEHIARLLQKKSFKVKQVTKEQYIMHKNIDNGLMPKLTEFKKNIYLHDIKHLCDIWTKENNNRPAKIKTLKKDIYQKLKLTDESVDRIFELLQEYKIVHVNHTKIGYNQGHIKNWSALDTVDYQPDRMTLKLRKKELALPPKVEYILGDMSLKRLKIICDLLFLLKKKPATINEFSEWLKEELMIEHVFSVQNIINTMQPYCVIEKRNHQIIFDKHKIDN